MCPQVFVIYNKMQTSHFAQINNLLSSNPDLQEFQQRLQSSPIGSNRYYLGLLLMSIAAMPMPKVQYIRILLKCGADVNFMEPSQQGGNEIGKSVLMIACEKSVSQNVRCLLGREDLQVGAVDTHGENALHYALRNQSQQEAVKIIAIILKQFPHLIKSHHTNFLFSAIEVQKLKVVDFLLGNYIDSNQQTQPVGLTPLQYTISLTGQLPAQAIIETLNLLLKYNADPRKQNFLNEDSYDYADKYLLQLEELVASEAQNRFTSKSMALETKCFTVCTYEDSRASYEKDEEVLRMDGNQQVIKQQEMGMDCSDQSIGDYQLQQQLQRSQQQSEEQQMEQTIQQFHFKVSNSIQNHSEPYITEHSLAYQQITPLYQFLYTLGQQLELKLEIIGSFATGLWTKNSDIDFVYINQKSVYVHVARKLEEVHKQIRYHSRQLGIVQMFLNLETNFPNIKIRMNLDHSQRRIEIGIFQRKCSSRKYVHFINQYVAYYPMIVPLFFLMHHLLQTFDLHRPTKYGLKTYTIFLMILTALQNYPSESISLSQAFGYLIYYYNNCYQYRHENEDNQSDPGKLIFNMMDPLNMGNNTGGRDTNTEALLAMFKALGHCLATRVKELRAHRVLEEMLELHRMFQ